METSCLNIFNIPLTNLNSSKPKGSQNTPFMLNLPMNLFFSLQREKNMVYTSAIDPASTITKQDLSLFSPWFLWGKYNAIYDVVLKILSLRKELKIWFYKRTTLQIFRECKHFLKTYLSLQLSLKRF